MSKLFDSQGKPKFDLLHHKAKMSGNLHSDAFSQPISMLTEKKTKAPVEMSDFKLP